MPPGGFEPEIPADDRPQNLALDRSATGMFQIIILSNVFNVKILTY